ncbi:MAG: proline--tRNA ligase, partial [Pseudonocardiales bacterium]|nr:proline--tRNA ligase [Pseudonocardiales bacterium]
HDAAGLVWPRAVAPFDVHVVVAGKTVELVQGGAALAAELDAAGLRVLLDDRKASPGVKFADAELIGVPTIVVVGRGLANGQVEVQDRATAERSEIARDGAVAHLVELVGKR